MELINACEKCGEVSDVIPVQVSEINTKNIKCTTVHLCTLCLENVYNMDIPTGAYHE